MLRDSSMPTLNWRYRTARTSDQWRRVLSETSDQTPNQPFPLSLRHSMMRNGRDQTIWLTRWLIPRALGMIGPRAKAAIPALHDLFDREDANVAVWAAEALWKIDPAHAPAGDRIIEKALGQTNRFPRVKAMRVHWNIYRQASVTPEGKDAFL